MRRISFLVVILIAAAFSVAALGWSTLLPAFSGAMSAAAERSQHDVPSNGQDDLARIPEVFAQAVASKLGIDTPCSKKWIDLLAEDSEDSRYAVVSLRMGKCRSLADEVIQLLHHPDSRVRVMATEALGAIGDERGVEVLKELIEGPDLELRVVALQSFCEMRPDDCRRSLPVYCLRSVDWQVRAAAVKLAGNLDYQFTSDALSRILTDRMGVPAIALRHMDCSLLEGNAALFGQVVGITEGVVNSAYHPFSEERKQHAYAALGALARCRSRAAGPRLIELLQLVQQYHLEDENTGILVEAVGICGGESAASVLEAFVISHTSPPHLAEVWASTIDTPTERALAALGEFGRSESLAAFSHALSDVYAGVRLAALKGAERRGVTSAMRKEIKSMSELDPSSTARKEALEVLTRIDNARSDLKSP